MGLPRVQCTLQVCCCCTNAGKFETICKREDPSSGQCPLCCRKPRGDTSEAQEVPPPGGRVFLGREGWQVCLRMALCPIALPCRAWNQHKLLTELYPVESTLTQSGVCGRIKAAICFPCMLSKHVQFLGERQWADELRYPWQTRAVWTVAGRPPSALFKVIALGDHGVGKTALSRALCGKGFDPEYTAGTAVSIAVRSYSRDGYPPAVLEIWDIPASAKTVIGPEILAGTSCSLLLIDLDDWNSFRTAKRWHSMIMEAWISEDDTPRKRRRRPPTFVMAGTKIDVSPVSKCGFLKAVKEWCDEHKCPLLFCTSFTGEGIVGLLRQIVISCFERHPPPSVLTLPYRNFH
eukprot:jgi/Undpi1/10923/HiC_scaffold_3.g01449.m1